MIPSKQERVAEAAIHEILRIASRGSTGADNPIVTMLAILNTAYLTAVVNLVRSGGTTEREAVGAMKADYDTNCTLLKQRLAPTIQGRIQ